MFFCSFHAIINDRLFPAARLTFVYLSLSHSRVTIAILPSQSLRLPRTSQLRIILRVAQNFKFLNLTQLRQIRR